MKDTAGIPPFWMNSGPLPSLSCAVLLIAASNRLSYALIAGSALVFVYTAVSAILKLAERAIPPTYAILIRVVTASAAASVFAAIAGALWPLAVRDLAFYIGAVPLCLLSSGLLDRAARLTPLRTVRASAEESIGIACMLVALALVREPFGFGALSLPAKDGLKLYFSSEKAVEVSLRSLSAVAGGFILLGYFLALFRRIKSRLYGSPSCSEDRP